jgi:AcrR family transcriptional regulator
MQDCTELGLRELKKAETRLAIEQAAVDIACEQGYEAATAEVIAARAKVSLRTFYNYFPSRDMAIVGEGPPLMDEERALAMLDEAEGKLLKGIARISEACFHTTGPAKELKRRRHRLIHQHAPLFHLHVIADVRFDRWLAGVVATHLEEHPAQRRLSGDITVEEEARLVVIMVSSAVHYHVRSAIENDVDVALSEQVVERTIDMMAEIHRQEP